ncbi:DUF4870 domain-containing protein [Thiohalorhabdus methylotrophus]|uniref:DUF4870 domain-containing protein n=1 Tax=Thiohalorhabdus methylotrophus TaxID=3242694 RepID=A0ABV4TU34_9GAMM
MITIATFDNQALAHIAKGRLEAEGIPARLADDHLVQTDWLYGAALGGIKIQVPEAHAARARSILAEDHSGELDLDREEPEPVVESPGQGTSSAPIRRVDVAKWAALVHLAAFAGLLIPLGHLLGPLLAWLGRRATDPRVDREGREAVNFQLSVTLYALAALAMASPALAYPAILALFVADTLLVLYAALRANRNQPFRYPLTIRVLS